MAGQILEYGAGIIRNQNCLEGINPVILQIYKKGVTLSQIAMATDKKESGIWQVINKEQG